MTILPAGMDGLHNVSLLLLKAEKCLWMQGIFIGIWGSMLTMSNLLSMVSPVVVRRWLIN